MGYEQTSTAATIVSLYQNSASVQTARAGDEVLIVLDHTPFYAESGGQVGDTGLLTAPAGDVTCALKVEVTDTRKNSSGIYLHSAQSAGRRGVRRAERAGER